MRHFSKALSLPTPEQALPGRAQSIDVVPKHFVSGRNIFAPFPSTMQSIVFGMGCFWGAERKFWSIEGVYVTSVGYAGGLTPNPAYEEVCSGMTGHTEVVQVVYDPDRCTLQQLLVCFWESHDPTQGMQQGNDVGTQYRSAIFYDDESAGAISAGAIIEQSKSIYAARLQQAGKGDITTEINAGITYYFAETHHQQYLAKNPQGYCGLGGCGVKFNA